MTEWRQVLHHGIPFSGYLVSRDGEVCSLLTHKILKPYVVGRLRYYAVALRDGGITHRRTVHTLVAEAFIGPRPPKADVCHTDGDTTNNNVANLRYASRRENLADRKSHGTAQIGERNPSATLTNVQAQQIRVRRMKGERLKTLAAAFGVNASTISRIANGVRRPE